MKKRPRASLGAQTCWTVITILSCVLTSWNSVHSAEVSAPVTPYVIDVDLRDLPPAPTWKPGDPIRDVPRSGEYGPDLDPVEPRGYEGLDLLAIRQQLYSSNPSRAFDTPIMSFAGEPFTGTRPSDPVGAVGMNYYAQAVNAPGGSRITFFNKNTGAQTARFQLDTLASSAPCNSGWADPIVLYDWQAQRWILSEFDTSKSGMCVYVSKTSNPISGGWYQYFLSTPVALDYPKYGTWPTDSEGGQGSYVVTSNDDVGSSMAPRIYAFDRGAMLAGAAATSQRFSDIPAHPGLTFQGIAIPADCDGDQPPPDGSPAFIMIHRDTESFGPAGYPGEDFLDVWELQVSWLNPDNSVLSKLYDPGVSVTEYDSNLCSLTGFACIPQPNTSGKLDPLLEVIMNRLQYMNHGTYETLVGNLTFDADGLDHAGIRWFELRGGAGAWALHQEGSYFPDTDSRWMGGISMDQSGNIALGFNKSNDSTIHPEIDYTGRLFTDPLGIMTLPEVQIVDGTSVNGSSRYGDYSDMSLDPEDGCTFWYTNNYNITLNHDTWIASFRFDLCGCPITVAPVTIIAANNGDNQIDVSWSDSATPEVTQYEVWRSTIAGGPYTQLATMPDDGGPYIFQDTTVIGYVTYYYIVYANDGLTCSSLPSDEAAETATGPCVLPLDFDGVQGVTNPSSAVCTLELAWKPATASCSGEIQYHVYRDTSPGFTPGPENLLITVTDLNNNPAWVGETGRVVLNDTIDQGFSAPITFSASYNNPVVVAMLNTRNGSESVEVRVKNLTSTGCDIFMEEPDGELHSAETASYLVVEEGRHALDQDLIVEAGTISSASVHSSPNAFAGDLVNFSSAFTSAPAVFSTLNSYGNGDFMSSVVHNVSTTGFQVEQEAAETGNEAGATAETIAWIAIETGGSLSNGQRWEVGSAADGTNDGPDNTPHVVSFASSFPATPDVVAAVNSGNGNDGSWARGAGAWNNTTHTLYAEEDQIGDTERIHTDETFAWAAFDPGFVFATAFHSDNNGLESGTTYYYVVQAEEVGGFTEANTVELALAPVGVGSGPQTWLSEDFDGGAFPPSGWSVTDSQGSGALWDLNTAFGDPNYTGGSGECAAAGQNSASGIDWDTRLLSPSIDLTNATSAEISYEMAFEAGSGNGICQIRVSVNGGSSTLLWGRSTSYGPARRTMSLDAYLGNTIQLQWRYAAGTGTSYLHIDDVVVGGVVANPCNSDCSDPSAASIDGIVDDEPLGQTGVTMTFTGGSPATSHVLVIDGVEQGPVTSPVSYNPGDTNSHDYVIRTYNTDSCWTDSAVSAFTDEDGSALCSATKNLVNAQWYQVSMPCVPVDASVSAVFGDDGLGIYGSDWAVLEWNEQTTAYRMLNVAEILQQGGGYWIKILSGDNDIAMSGTNASSPFEVNVAGNVGGVFNFIGHPFNTTVDWDQVTVDIGDGVFKAVADLDAAEATTIFSSSKWEYTGMGYSMCDPRAVCGATDDPSLAPFDGFWVKAFTDTTLHMPSSGTRSNGRALLDNEWYIRLTATAAGGLVDESNLLGRITGAQDGQDSLDIENLAPFDTPYLEVVFPHPEWSGDAWSYTTDYREVRAGAGGEWSLEVRSDVAREVTLTWLTEGDASIMPGSVLIDEEAGITIDPAVDGAYTLMMASPTHRLIWRVDLTSVSVDIFSDGFESGNTDMWSQIIE